MAAFDDVSSCAAFADNFSIRAAAVAGADKFAVRNTYFVFLVARSDVVSMVVVLVVVAELRLVDGAGGGEEEEGEGEEEEDADEEEDEASSRARFLLVALLVVLRF